MGLCLCCACLYTELVHFYVNNIACVSVVTTSSGTHMIASTVSSYCDRDVAFACCSIDGFSCCILVSLRLMPTLVKIGCLILAFMYWCVLVAWFHVLLWTLRHHFRLKIRDLKSRTVHCKLCPYSPFLFHIGHWLGPDYLLRNPQRSLESWHIIAWLLGLWYRHD